MLDWVGANDVAKPCILVWYGENGLDELVQDLGGVLGLKLCLLGWNDANGVAKLS